MLLTEVSEQIPLRRAPTNHIRWHKQYAGTGKDSVAALQKYREEVQARVFPSAENVSSSDLQIYTLLANFVFCRATRCGLVN